MIRMPDRAPRPSTVRGLRRPARATVAVLLVALGGCSTWHATDRTPHEVFAEQRPSKVRVTTGDGDQTVLTRPRVLGDVLAGFDEACIAEFGRNEARCPETGIPVFEISVFEVHRRGAAAMILPAVGGLTAAWLLANR